MGHPLILITRPEEDSAETARMVERFGFDALCMPALAIRWMMAALPEVSSVSGIIFSSVNGVRAFIKQKNQANFLKKPVFAVGTQTEDAARAAGFTDVRRAGGTMRDLAALIRRQMVPPARLIHVRGWDVRDNPALLLPVSEGWAVDGLVLYAAEAVDALSLPERRIDAVLFYSLRSAEAFLKAAGNRDFSRTKALCLADSVVESLHSVIWDEIRVAPQPDADGMAALLKAFAEERGLKEKAEDSMQTKPKDEQDRSGEFSGMLEDAVKSGDRQAETRHREATAVTYEEMMKELKKSQLAAIRKSVAASTGLILVLAMFAGMFVAIGHHRLKGDEDRLAALESQPPEGGTAAAGDKRTPFAKMMDSLSDRIASLESSFSEVKSEIGGVAGNTGGSLTQRLATIEQTVNSLAGSSPDLSAVISRTQNPELAAGAGAGLQALVSGLQGRMDKMETELAEQQKTDSALGQALQGVSPKELKAAALLIGLNQFRSTLSRSEPFGDDLAMLQNMVGRDDPELNEAITKLAPYAEKGVLSPDGLSNQLTGLAGDIVQASLTGQDVSIQDQAMARLNKFVTIEKDGQPLNATDTQAAVARAQAQLKAGDVDGAMQTLQALKGPARQAAQPVIDQGQVTLMAQQVSGMLGRNVVSQIKSALHGPVPLTAQSGLGGMGPQFKMPEGMPPVQ